MELMIADWVRWFIEEFIDQIPAVVGWVTG